MRKTLEEKEKIRSEIREKPEKEFLKMRPAELITDFSFAVIDVNLQPYLIND